MHPATKRHKSHSYIFARLLNTALIFSSTGISSGGRARNAACVSATEKVREMLAGL
jgi:hypothetical protein